MPCGCEVGVRKKVARAHGLTTCPQTHPTKPTHHPATTRQMTRQTLRVYLRQRRRPAKQKETQPRVRIHHGIAEGQRTQESGVRTRNELGEWGG